MAVNWDHAAIERAIGQAALDRALLQAAEHVLDESNRLVPHETGDLERSGQANAEGGRAIVSYESPYAVRQHEELGYRHDAGRSAKYLEKGAMLAAPVVEDIVARELRRGGL